ncbi:hypothetical protein OS493_039334 [Desmophyllum pertusum]|uniref:Uncharacterized protein n=1 Tax=Desmophyllum pertusum TaxID=174260 RepID=A0A9W9ZUR4_9CNID|nr:hypothetical protein OS493_039334 [Desmophyllum pertusum]
MTTHCVFFNLKSTSGSFEATEVLNPGRSEQTSPYRFYNQNCIQRINQPCSWWTQYMLFISGMDGGLRAMKTQSPELLHRLSRDAME